MAQTKEAQDKVFDTAFMGWTTFFRGKREHTMMYDDTNCRNPS
jgi:hypothetical protein